MKQCSLLRRTFVAAALTVGVSLPGTAMAVPHEGDILGAGNTNIGGILFSSIHRSNTNNETRANGFSESLSGAVAYDWNPAGAPQPGSTQLFDRGPVTVTTFTLNGHNYSMDLWTGSAAVNGANSITAGASVSGSVDASSQGLGTINGLHKASGQFNFEITETDGNGQIVGVLSDILFFDIATQMGSVNKVGANDDGVVTTFLWGYTSQFIDNENDPFTGSTSCAVGGVCSNIIDDIYGTAGLGIDIAYSGSRVPEPGVVALFGIGLLGLGLARRRKMKL